ncbi:MAG: YHS domain-containing protein [Deltaproteobacteria bacterium]|nr:YHS domain-containing protein [Deltaproteobacteria bacterium]
MQHKPIQMILKVLVTGLLATTWLLAGCGGAQKTDSAAPAAAEITCPVSGKPFTPTADSPKSEYKGKTYVFCCGGCKAKFDANPDQFADKAAAAATPAGPAMAVCPVSGEKFAPTADSPKSEYKGKTYVFCCGGCKTKFDADPEKILAAPGKHPDCGGDCDDKAPAAK